MAGLVSQMTRKAIESEIRKKTHIVNERLKQFYNEGNENIMVSSEINKLQSIAGKGRGKNKIGLGLRKKTKQELVRQLRELKYFEQWDIYTEEGQRSLEARERKAWESFYKDNPGFTYQEWRNLVETFGSISESVLQQFGSTNIVEAYKDAENGKKINLLKYITNISRDKSMQGTTQEQKIDRLRELLSEDGDI